MPPARRKRAKSKNYTARRESIIDMAAELFARNGYASTGVADLGEYVQLERGALYYYIGSKEQLLADIHDRVMQPLLRDSERICSLPGSPLARLRLLSESLLSQVIGRKDHVWVFLHEYRALQGERRHHFKEQRDRFEAYIDSLLSESEEQGLLRFENRRVSLLFFLGTHNYTYQWIRSEPGLTPSEVSRIYCATFLRGLAVGAFDVVGLEREADALRQLLADEATAADA